MLRTFLRYGCRFSIAIAILKIVFLSDFSEILYEEAERQVDNGYGTKKCSVIKIYDVQAMTLSSEIGW